MASELLKLCMKKGFLLDREMLDLFTLINEDKAQEIITTLSGLGVKEKVINKKTFLLYLDRLKAALLRFSDDSEFTDFFSHIQGEQVTSINPAVQTPQPLQEEGRNPVKLLSAPAFPQRKVTVNDFVTHFKSRFEQIRAILERRDFDDLTSIRKIGHNKGSYTIIATVIEKRITKNKNIMISVEDMTGTSTILINQNKKELFEAASKIIIDDILAFSVTGNSDLLFCNEFFYPDSGLSEKKRHTEDMWVAFITDIHCGSKQFLEKELLNFIRWINKGSDNETYGNIAKNLKYIFVGGDLVDGVNHYPGQEKNLNILSCRGQYKKFEDVMSLVRSDIDIIVCPGDHDAVWVGEPQPIINEKWAPGLYEKDNIHLVPNPSIVEIAGGFKILMYHGTSFIHFVEHLPEIRLKYGLDSPSVIAKEMLKRRHLAPMHGFVDYIPCLVDNLVINTIPDILFTGHLHKLDVSTYNNILTIAGSCFQGMTDFMEKVGVEPDFCKVPLFNLRTREIKILDFSSESSTVEWDQSTDLFCDLESYNDDGTELKSEIVPEEQTIEVKQ